MGLRRTSLSHILLVIMPHRRRVCQTVRAHAPPDASYIEHDLEGKYFNVAVVLEQQGSVVRHHHVLEQLHIVAQHIAAIVRPAIKLAKSSQQMRYHHVGHEWGGT